MLSKRRFSILTFDYCHKQLHDWFSLVEYIENCTRYLMKSEYCCFPGLSGIVDIPSSSVLLLKEL